MADEVLDAEVLPREEEEADPTDLRAVFFRRVRLSEDQKLKVEQDLFELVRDGMEERSDLDNLLAHWNDLAEGISPPKTFPWPNSSNLHVPLTETKLNEIHASARQSMLRPDQLFYIRRLGVQVKAEQQAKLEAFLNFKVGVELPLVDKFNQLFWASMRDGTALGMVTWEDDRRPCEEIATYTGVEEFITKYPTPKDAGLSKTQYGRVMEKLQNGQTVRLVETRMKSRYRGPRVDVVELQDFLMCPMTSVKTEYARLVSRIFNMRGPELRSLGKQRKFSEEDVEKVIASKQDGRHTDIGPALKDQIEGISRRSKPGEFVLVNGIYRGDINETGMEENYFVLYHPLTKTLLDIIKYPYLHGRDNFVPIRIKKRPNRFLGRGICAMLDDLNQELNTQHNQRIDSRTITTVPTFMAKESVRNQFDPSRADMAFQPGRTFWLDDFAALKQLEVRETDMGESMQEEQNNLQMGDKLVGSSSLRSGQETKMDPRAPAAKVSMLLNQSNIRLDDFYEEASGNGAENEGFKGIGDQILALYYQFWDQDLGSIPVFDENSKAIQGKDQNEAALMSLTQEDLNVLGKVKIQLAKTSSAMNPDASLARFFQLYSLLVNDPLVGGRWEGRYNLDRRLLELAREEDPDQFLPAKEFIAQVSQKMPFLPMGGGAAQKGKGAGQARNRGGAVRPAGQQTTKPVQ